VRQVDQDDTVHLVDEEHILGGLDPDGLTRGVLQHEGAHLHRSPDLGPPVRPPARALRLLADLFDFDSNGNSFALLVLYDAFDDTASRGEGRVSTARIAGRHVEGVLLFPTDDGCDQERQEDERGSPEEDGRLARGEIPIGLQLRGVGRGRVHEGRQ